jgi:hypothetical protein
VDEDAVILTSYFRERDRAGAGSLGGALIDLYGGRLINPVSDLTGIYDLGPLNQLLQAASQPTVST